MGMASILPGADCCRGKRILLVEDDPDIAALLSLHVTDLGTCVTTIDDGVDALAAALREPWDMLILDLGLPGLDGLRLAEQVRRHAPGLPILMVTARGAESERVSGLDAGADDYIVKPFSMAELVARVRALFRRCDVARTAPERQMLIVGDLILDFDARTVSVSGHDIELTGREFGLLSTFMRSPGRTFSRSELLETVWGTSYAGYRHTVNTHINRLRAKIEPDPAAPCHVLTVRGLGYRLAPPA